MLVVTTNDLPGYKVVKHLGIVRGITVRSRSVIGNIGAAVQIFFGGNITLYTKLAEETRSEAYEQLVEHARVQHLRDGEGVLAFHVRRPGGRARLRGERLGLDRAEVEARG